MKIRQVVLGTVACCLALAPHSSSASEGDQASTSSQPPLVAVDNYAADDHPQLVIHGDGSAPAEKGTFGYQTQAIEVLYNLETLLPKTFVAAGKVPDEFESYYVAFTTEPSESVLQNLRIQPFTTTVSWGYGATALELREAAAMVTRAALNNADVAAYQVSPDPYGRGVRAEVNPRAGATIDDLAAEIADTANAEAVQRQSALPPIAVTLTENPELGSGYQQQKEVKGGHSVPGPCTTGFTVARYSNLGILTAGHCGTSLYDNDNTVLGGPTVEYPPANSPNWGSYVDIQYATTMSPHTTGKKFRYAAGAETTVTGVANPYPNMDICNYRLATGKKCGNQTPLKVSYTFVCANSTTSNRSICELAQTNREATAGGDSGGPWYVDQAAYGVHSGGGGGASYFTMAGVLGAAFGGYNLVIRQN